ncbi:hypothetical protein PWG71_17095 [Nocardiopsis sp. N85]|uniref:hypothetical protein n=1 Tax=Nocardiopsis sp. N85 TaxID=3029400 RepID=UPI00237F1439|nr:hypothetical protein [Nocardiopsis sp. N85]MDE3723110.1 hypothetical protein [Nocardiopsis sp. N85]
MDNPVMLAAAAALVVFTIIAVYVVGRKLPSGGTGKGDGSAAAMGDSADAGGGGGD